MSLDVYLTMENALQSNSGSVYSANITHNLHRMAAEAGLFTCLWRPDEIDITKASQLIEFLEGGLDILEKHPKRFKKFNPENGWGDYEGLVGFTRDYLEACKKYPNASVGISR